MNSAPSASRGRLGRAIELLALASALMAAFIAGALFSPWRGVPRWVADSVLKYQQSSRDAQAARASERVFEVPPPPPPKQVNVEDGIPPLHPPPREDPRLSEPRALQARAAVIRRDAAATGDECQAAAGGDWENWQRDTAIYRRNLKSRIDSLEGGSRSQPARSTVLEGRPDFPLFEVAPGERLAHLYDERRLDPFRAGRAVPAANRWLREQGIDLIFVPVPPLTAVYIEQFLDPCPPDGIVAPHVRKAWLDLLDADVEVVDCWRLFRSLRDAGSDFLYDATGSRRSPRGLRIIAKEIADRIDRYAFGARARFALPIVRPAPAPAADRPDAKDSPEWAALSPAQRERARPAEAPVATEVRMQDGEPPSDDPTSPVVVIGGGDDPHIREQLVNELNLLVHMPDAGLPATEAFARLVRNRTLLDHCRVVVWIADEQQIAEFVAMPPSRSTASESIKSALK
jgi:hypothetical protein